MNTKRILFLAIALLLLGGCYATSNQDNYKTETAKAIIDGANNICVTIFLGSVMRAVCNK